MEFYKGRNITIGTKVAVYYNIRKKLFSVKALEGEHEGRVVAHLKGVRLCHAIYKVIESGRQRVLREGRKNVHAYVIGQFLGEPKPIDLSIGKDVSYNPLKHDTFITIRDKQPIYKSNYATLYNRQVKASVDSHMPL